MSHPRTLVLGDIHGGYKALVQVLELAKLSPQDTLICLGDYVDGWSESPHVIALLLELQQQQSCIFIRGNHDALYYEWLQNPNVIDEKWYTQGGQSTIEAYQQLSDQEKLTHLHFLENLKYYHIDSKNRLFLHAGFTNAQGVAYEDPLINCCWDRTLWRETWASTDTPPVQLQNYYEVYIGHTPTLQYESGRPLNKYNVWNMDTGAGFTGALSLMDIDTKQVWQSSPLTDLYPAERGRN